jgi:hypothetical protein
MGQQQLLLIVLATIIIGIAIIFSITLFRQKAIDSKRDLLINECGNLAMDAMKYYKRPSNLGGGGNTFTGWSIPEILTTTATGDYSVIIFSDSVLIIGTGNDIVNGTDSVKVQISVYQDNYKTQIIN